MHKFLRRAFFCYVHCFTARLPEEAPKMSVAPQPNVRLINSPEYRDGYANSVQVRVSVWDFFLTFGRLQPVAADEVEVQNFQGIYLSPQQAKALLAILQQNVTQYEKAFGEIKLDVAVPQPTGPIH
jgi:flagellar protein FlaG